MGKFIKKIILFLMPIFIFCIIAEILLRGIPNDYKIKAEYLEKNSSEIEVLVLGNSQSFYGIIPELFDLTCYNSAYNGQSLDIDYLILNKHIDKISELKYLIIPISYLSLYYNMFQNKNGYMLKYNIYSKLDIPNGLFYSSEILNNSLSDNLEKLFNYYHLGIYDNITSPTGFIKNMPDFPEWKKKELATDIVKGRNKKNKMECFEYNIKILENIIKLLESKNVKIIFFTPPVPENYYNGVLISQYELMEKTLNQFAELYQNCIYINLFKSDNFGYDDFYDGQHLNSSGAEKLTKKIIEIMNLL